MTPERHQKATRIFLDACHLESTSRSLFLESECGEDTELRDYVEKMLAQDGRELPIRPPDSSVSAELRPLIDNRHDSGADVRRNRLPSKIGAYRIIDKLGEGGMGVVYLAEQEKPRRTVALKVIKSGLLSADVRRRFEHEFHILGRLQHPGIAQIFEAGTAETDQGEQPFFALEYIEGRPLTDYAMEKKLSVHDRLALIVRVCEAIQHAHQKGVIHRDLKPANILVVDEGEGGSGDLGTHGMESTRSSFPRSHGSLVSFSAQPKILDFGVARVTDSDIQVTTLQTNVGQLIGTIPYMSPEQVTGNVNELDTRSDVYALGVLCYQLLTGHLPHDVRGKHIPEAARMIQEEEPASLSSINRSYRGDIETIVLKALEKDKHRRYQSASELAADIRRFLHDEPIVARPASKFYQLRKFARRNKALVTGVVVAFIAMSWGLIHVTVERNRAVGAEQRALSAERDAKDEAVRAQAEAAKAERVVHFLQGMMASANPDLMSGGSSKDMTVVEAIDVAIRQVDLELGEEREAQAAVRNTIGRTLTSLANYEKAEEQLRLALAMRKELHGDKHEDVIESLNDLGNLLKQMGRYREAEECHRQALNIGRELFGPENASVAEILSNLGSTMLGLGQRDRAESLFRESLAMSRKCLGNEHQMTARCMNNVARMLLYQKAYGEAEKLLRESLAILRKQFGDRGAMTINVMTNLAYVLKQTGDVAAAIELNREVLKIVHEHYDDKHPRLATHLNNLAVMLRQEGDFEEAEKIYRRVIDLRRETLGERHPKVSLALNNLGYLLFRTNRLDEAETVLSESLKIQQEVLPERHPSLLPTIGKLSDVILAKQDYERAEPLLREGHEVAKRNLDEDDWGMGLIRSKLGRSLVQLKRYDEAEPLLLYALNILEKDGTYRGEGAAALRAVIELYEILERPEEAGRYRAMLQKAEVAEGVASN